MSAINKIQEGSFAEACYNHNTVVDLIAMLVNVDSADDCEAWGITRKEWREQIELAIAALEEKAAAE
jgi:hypothetical protein